VAAIALPMRRTDRGWELFWARRSPKLAFLGGFWAFPGGGAEPADADLRATAVRELEEETGLVVGPERLVPAGRTITPAWADSRFDAWYFLFEAPEGAAPKLNAELVEGEWTDAGEALARWDRGERLTTPVAVLALRAVAGGGELAEIGARLAEALAAAATR